MKASSIYTAKQKVWGVLMILALLWLTVSLPFVYNAQQILAKLATVAVALDDSPAENSEDASPLSSVEEKAACNLSVLEEYIHHYDETFSSNNPKLSHIDNRSYDLYIAFHGELLSPPPEPLPS